MNRFFKFFSVRFDVLYYLKLERSGFTLIELLVVIAIIAVLAVAVILTLNPAELLKQARDSTRISDLNTIKRAISIYLVDVNGATISSTCNLSIVSSGYSKNCNSRYAVGTATGTSSGIFTNDGTGWAPFNFTAISSGAPIGNLPKDPTNASGVAGTGASSTALYYSYIGSSTSLTFELGAAMESLKYSSGGGADVVSTDGGNSTGTSDLYEVGTNLNL